MNLFKDQSKKSHNDLDSDLLQNINKLINKDQNEQIEMIPTKDEVK